MKWSWLAVAAALTMTACGSNQPHSSSQGTALPTHSPAVPTAPTLGRAWTQYLEGYGHVRPGTISDGGTYNQVSRVVWKSWGGSEAVGFGYMRDLRNTTDANTPRFSKVTVIAYDLGFCHEQTIYRKVAFLPAGVRFNPSRGFAICDASSQDRP